MVQDGGRQCLPTCRRVAALLEVWCQVGGAAWRRFGARLVGQAVKEVGSGRMLAERRCK